MRRTSIATAGVALLAFGFLALMAWTGKLAGIDWAKVRLFAWLVEDLAVAHLGRAGATALFAALGLLSAAVVLWARRPRVHQEPTAVKVPASPGARPSDTAERDGGETGGSVWMSSVKGNYALGNKPGVRTKYHGREWEPAEFNAPPVPDDVLACMRRSGQGFALARNELPDAAAVWNEQRFRLLGDIFYAGGFLVVRGKLAEALSRFDLGEGGLVPFPVYRADLATAYPGEFFLLNFGAIKNTILPERCEDARKFLVRKATGMQVWHINNLNPDGEVVLSPQALVGPDLWVEEAVHDKIFLSDALARAIVDIGLGDVFILKQCRIAADAA